MKAKGRSWGARLDQTDKSVAEGGKLSGLRVLIAEDQWLLADTMAVLLEEEGATVIGPCPTTVGAMKRIDSEPVDFALVDMGLKDTFSDPLIEKLEAQRIPYAVITGFEFLPTNAHEGAIEVIKKPISKKALFELLSPFVHRTTPPA
jgi:DNA-binding NtrC family response regulator